MRKPTHKLWYRTTAIVAVLFVVVVFSAGHFSRDRLPPPIPGDPDRMRLTEITADGFLFYQDIKENVIGTSNPEFRLPALDELLRRGRRYRHPVTSILGQVEDGLRFALRTFERGAHVLLGKSKRDPGGLKLVAVDSKSRTFKIYGAAKVKLARHNKSANPNKPEAPKKTRPIDGWSHDTARTAARTDWSASSRLRPFHNHPRAHEVGDDCRLPGLSGTASSHVVFARGGLGLPGPGKASRYGASEVVLKGISTPVVLYLVSASRVVWSIEAGEANVEAIVALGSKDVGIEGIGPDVPVMYLGSGRRPEHALQRTCRKILDRLLKAGKGLFPTYNAHSTLSALRAMAIIVEETSGAPIATMQSGEWGLRYVIDQEMVADQERSRRSAQSYLDNLPPLPLERLPDDAPILKMSDRPAGITPSDYLLQSGYMRRLTRREVDLVLADLAAQRAVLGETDTNVSLAALRFAESFAVLGPIDLRSPKRIHFDRGFLVLAEDVPLPTKKSYGLASVVRYGRPSCLKGEGWNSGATWCLVRK